MKRNKKGKSPSFVLEIDNFDIQEIVCSAIVMFSVFCWDNTYKNPCEDEFLVARLEEIQKYIEDNYMEEKNV